MVVARSLQAYTLSIPHFVVGFHLRSKGAASVTRWPQFDGTARAEEDRWSRPEGLKADVSQSPDIMSLEQGENSFSQLQDGERAGIASIARARLFSSSRSAQYSESMRHKI